MKPLPPAALVSVALLLAGSAAHAHETWLLPSSFSARPSQALSFSLTSGTRFPGSGSPIKPERLAQAGVRLAGAEQPLRPVASSRGVLALSHAMPTAGAATVWLTLKPREIDLSDAKVAEYLDEIGADTSIRLAWAAQKGRAPWHETYTKHAKTFVDVAAGEADTSWGQAVGMGFEIVPLSNPLLATKGQSFRARLVAASKPLAGASMALAIKGAPRPVFQTTDAQGVASFTLRHSGEAMLYAVHLRQAPGPAATGPRWVSDFTTTTLRVKAR